MKKVRIVVLVMCLAVLTGLGIYLWSNSVTFQVAAEIINRVETREKVVALTFDDGPTGYVDEILAVLAEKNVNATFYVIGEQIASDPERAKKIVQAGHELGNHPYTHQRMIFKSYSFYQEEIDKTNDLIREVGYQGEITFRPPYGKKLIGLPLYLNELGMKTITWDVESTKYLSADASEEEITEYVSNKAQPGSIILIHPWYGEENAGREAIGPVIDELQAEGYQFVTITELLQKR